MGLFDENDVQSEEMAALLLAQDILSTSDALQTLLQAADAATAKALIVVGPNDPPYNGVSYTVDELEDRIAWAQVYPEMEGSLLVGKSLGVGGRPEIEGIFHLHVRRQILQSEYGQYRGRADAWKYFTDQTSAMCEDFGRALDESVTNATLRGSQIKRLNIPLFNNSTEHKTQGIFVFADFAINWGDSTRGQ